MWSYFFPKLTSAVVFWSGFGFHLSYFRRFSWIAVDIQSLVVCLRESCLIFPHWPPAEVLYTWRCCISSWLPSLHIGIRCPWTCGLTWTSLNMLDCSDCQCRYGFRWKNPYPSAPCTNTECVPEGLYLQGLLNVSMETMTLKEDTSQPSRDIFKTFPPKYDPWCHKSS